MVSRFARMALTSLSVLASASFFAQSPGPAPANPQAAPRDEAMTWDRDFDLLLELNAAPTKAQQAAEERRQALEKERADLADRLDDLQSRLAAIEGTYTSEALLNEMLRQGVGDVQSAQANLRLWIRKDQERVREIDAELQKMAARARE